MIRTVVLILSLAANGALLAAALRTGSNAATSVAAVRKPPTLEVVDGGYASWRAIGLGEHDARTLLATELETAALQSLPPPRPYWQTGRGSVERAAGVAAAMANVRQALEAEFGAAAAELPEFARAFRPLAGELGFLTSAEQLAVQSWRLQKQQALAAEAPELRLAATAPPAGVRRAALSDPAARWTPDSELDELAAILPPDAAFDVAVRESPLAERLRATGVAFSEAEFRDTFASLGAAASTAPDPNEQVALRRRLRALLGPERFHGVWASRDPVADAVRRASAALGLSDAARASAYQILNDTQERLMEFAAGGDLASEHAIAAARTIAMDEEARLAALLGEHDAAAVLAARAEFWDAARTAGGAPPR